MQALLWAHAPISPACPFTFLLNESQRAAPPEDPQASLSAHLDWLSEHHLCASRQKPALSEAWSLAFRLLASPRNRIQIIDATPQKTRRMSFVSDERVMVFAMFDRSHCLISEPVSFDNTMERLLDAIGCPTEEEDSPTPLRTDYRVLRVMGALVEAGLAMRPHGQSNGLGLSEARAERLLERLFGDEIMGRAVLVDLMADRLLVSDGQKVWIHPDFAPWHAAIDSSSQLELQRLHLPEGEVPSDTTPDSTLFLGPRRSRCLLLPCKDSDEFVLARPHRHDLRSLIGDFLGAPDLDASSILDAKVRAHGKFSFRG